MSECPTHTDQGVSFPVPGASVRYQRVCVDWDLVNSIVTHHAHRVGAMARAAGPKEGGRLEGEGGFTHHARRVGQVGPRTGHREAAGRRAGAGLPTTHAESGKWFSGRATGRRRVGG
jgi:hypothetical protein